MQPVQRVTIWRRLVQIAALAVTGEWLVTGLTRCPFAVPFVSCTACPLTECPGRYLPVPAIGVALLSALLAGRVFCGWACPMGFVEDLLGRIPKLKALTCPPFARVERWLKPAGYAVVLLVVYLVVTVHLSAERPYPYVVRSSSVLNLDAAESAVALGAAQYRVRLWILVPVLVLSVLVTRFWCRYLCPLGAVLGCSTGSAGSPFAGNARTCHTAASTRASAFSIRPRAPVTVFCVVSACRGAPGAC